MQSSGPVQRVPSGGDTQTDTEDPGVSTPMQLMGWRIRIRVPAVDVHPPPFATESMHVLGQNKQPKRQLYTAMQVLEEVTGEDVRFDFERSVFETEYEQPRDWDTLQEFVRALRWTFCRGGFHDQSNATIKPASVGWCRDDRDREWKIRNEYDLVLDDVLMQIELVRRDSDYASVIDVIGAPVTWANETAV